MYSDIKETQPNRALALLSAIAVGDAVIEDIAAELRHEGIESLEEVLQILREGTKEQQADEANALKPVNFNKWRKKTRPELASRIVQKVPQIPFIFNGTLYEPEDITRFNGQELHFVPTPAGDEMLVVDDRDLIVDWWHLAYFEQYKNLGTQLGVGGNTPTSEDMAISSVTPFTRYYEHINHDGSYIMNNKNYGWYNLTKVCRAFLCTSSWNDVISSVLMNSTSVTVLHEHINWTGQTLTLFNSHSDLRVFGWNDKTSSTETW